MRDGVNINSAEKIKRLVLPDEVKNLPPLTCYVKLCGEYPITKLKVKLQAQGKLLMFFSKIFNKNKEEIVEVREESVRATHVTNIDNTIPSNTEGIIAQKSELTT